MIVKWTTSKPVIARITRNIKGVDADMLFDLPEWIAEAILKLKTSYSLQLNDEDIDVHFHKAQLPCSIEGLAAVTYCGMRLMIGDDLRNIKQRMETGDFVYSSVIRYPGVSNLDTLDATDINNFPFYLNTVEALGILPICSDHWYRPNGNFLDTSIKEGKLRIYYWSIPTDEDSFPMVPDNENYQTAVYWYCRMMMIGAGFEDPVFKFTDCEARWDLYAGRAINEITYPTPDEKKRTIMNTTGLIPHQYDWELFGGGGRELPYNDDLV